MSVDADWQENNLVCVCHNIYVAVHTERVIFVLCKHLSTGGV